MNKNYFYLFCFVICSAAAMEIQKSSDKQMPISHISKMASFLSAFMNRSVIFSDNNMRYPFYGNEFMKQPIYITKLKSKIPDYFQHVHEIVTPGLRQIAGTSYLQSHIERFIFMISGIFLKNNDLPDSYEELKREVADMKIAIEALKDKKKFDAGLPDVDQITELTREGAFKIDVSEWMHGTTKEERDYLLNYQKQQRSNLKKIRSQIRHSSKESGERNAKLADMTNQIKQNRERIKESANKQFDQDTYFNKPIFLADFLKSDNNNKN